MLSPTLVNAGNKTINLAQVQTIAQEGDETIVTFPSGELLILTGQEAEELKAGVRKIQQEGRLRL